MKWPLKTALKTAVCGLNITVTLSYRVIIEFLTITASVRGDMNATVLDISSVKTKNTARHASTAQGALQYAHICVR